MSRRVHLSGLPSELGTAPFRLLIGLGFDQRALTVLKVLLPVQPHKIHALLNVGGGAANSSNISLYGELTGGDGNITGEGAESILQLADELTKLVCTFDPAIRTVIDISSMSHELLSVLMAILKQYDRLHDLLLCYTGAAAYSVGSLENEIWLSRGVSSIRSVLGYAGEHLPSKPLHLVITVGFEVERALEVISTFEPDVLSLGIGRRADSVTEAHHDTNARFFSRLNEFVQEQKGSCESVATFPFSCVDPWQTMKDLEDHLSVFQGLNTVVCPLNTKVSTVGINLLCFAHPEIQLCYAQPNEYNTEGYVEPGEWITLIDI